MNIIIFGPQGSGKGTQAELLAAKYNLAHIETGQIFREIGREKSELGKKVSEIINVRKELIPDDMTAEIIGHYMEKVPNDTGIILDSAPRTVGQIKPFEKMLKTLGRNIDKAIYISLPYEDSVARITKRYTCMLCYRNFILGKDIQDSHEPCPTCSGPVMQREDDTPEGVTKRLNTFYKITIPVVEYYREKGLLAEIDGNQSREEVFEDITSKLE